MTDPAAKLKLSVIIASVRDGRFADTIAGWFHGVVSQHSEYEVDVLDLAKIDVPNGFPGDDHPGVAELTARVGAADAFVIITPEYNHGYPGTLKNAIDQVYAEWQTKPIAFVSYGGVSGGLRAVEQLKQVFGEVHAVPIRDSVSFHGAWNQFHETGEPRDVTGVGAAAKTMLDRLAWWASALRTERERRPYDS